MSVIVGNLYYVYYNNNAFAIREEAHFYETGDRYKSIPFNQPVVYLGKTLIKDNYFEHKVLFKNKVGNIVINNMVFLEANNEKNKS